MNACIHIVPIVSVLNGIIKLYYHNYVRVFSRAAHRQGMVICKCLLKCVMLNVVLFRGALFVYEELLPRVCSSLLGIELRGDSRYELVVLLGWSAPVPAAAGEAPTPRPEESRDHAAERRRVDMIKI